MRIYFPHARYTYKPLNLLDYLKAATDIIFAKLLNAQNLTFHIPTELMFPSMINVDKGLKYVKFVEGFSKKNKVLVVWENTAYLSVKDWSLIEKATWKYVPKNVWLCLDTGHLMLGEKNPRKKILQVVRKYGRRIKHLHLHENDLVHDLHIPPGKILKPLMDYLRRGRTWIVEPPG